MTVCFLGNMNNFPFGIAKEFQKRNYKVTQFIDVPQSILLDRPESTDKNLLNNYPDWILDLKINVYGVKHTLFLLFPSIFYRSLIKKIHQYDAIFLNGNWLKIGKYISPEKFVVGLLAGTEVDGADQSRVDMLVANAMEKGHHYFRLPAYVYKIFYKKMIQLQRDGLRRVNVVNYYLPEVNPEGDKVLHEIKKGQQYAKVILRGFDTSLFNYIEPDLKKQEFVILSITRFCFTPEVHDNKRNDIMLRGIAAFIKQNDINRDLKIIFFEKGVDLQLAKEMCHELGIDKFVNWVPLVPMDELKNYFGECHVAFDQLGDQWVGAGLFSMLTGRPLIANGRGDLYEKYLGERIPVCQAKDESEVCAWLTKIYLNRDLIKKIGAESRDYVLRYYDIRHNIDFYISEMEKFFEPKTSRPLGQS